MASDRAESLSTSHLEEAFSTITRAIKKRLLDGDGAASGAAYVADESCNAPRVHCTRTGATTFDGGAPFGGSCAAAGAWLRFEHYDRT